MSQQPGHRRSSGAHAAGPSVPESETAHRELVHGANPATSIIAYLLAGPLTFGLIGWGLDQWIGTSFLIIIGILLGMGLAFYVIWLRYAHA